VREDFNKARSHLVPVIENPLGASAGSQLQVRQQQISDDHNVRLIKQGLQIDRIQIAPLLAKISALVEDIGHTPTHTGSKISAAGAEHQHNSVSHVFAAVVADTLDDRGRSRVADGKTLAGNPVEECFAASGAVKSDIADDDIFFRSEAGSAGRKHHDSAPREALPDIVVGFSLERKRNSLGEERSQALTSRTREVNANRIVGQSSGAITACDFTAEHASDGAVNVAYRKLYFNRNKGFEGRGDLSE